MYVFLRRTTEYAIETTDNLPLSYNKKWSLPLFFHYKLFSYRRFPFNFISAGQIFRKQILIHKKNLFDV